MSQGRRRVRLATGVAALTLALGAGIASSASAVTFSNTTPISIPTDNGTETADGSPFPSTITASGITTAVAGTTVTLNNVSRVFADDLDALLRGPGGQTVVLLSDSCATTDFASTTLVFSDGAASMLPAMATAACAGGTFKPTDNAPTEPSPAWPTGTPAGPYGTSLSALAASPNGNWDLFVRNGGGMHDVGSIAGGWTLDLVPGTLSVGGGLTPVEEGPCKFKRHGADVIVGTSGDDVLTGNLGPDNINGLGGDDRIRGRGGEDKLCGGSGDDRIFGGDGNDTLIGRSGNDELHGNAPSPKVKRGTRLLEGDHCTGGSGQDDFSSCEFRQQGG